ncbi:MAG TPA: sugar transferase [Deltaproteobacteria bacterium]|nr:sugar transferase [Deltaproteobacteria bacterium]
MKETEAASTSSLNRGDWGKRTFDIVFSVAGLMVLSPIMLTVSLLILVEDGLPLFYRGLRVGRYGRPFNILKFRSMVKDAEKIGGSSTPEDDPRITKVGRFIRRYKLDELPQLINVLKGEMSFVGPRPQVQWAVDLYSEEERLLLTVRPGITDYASIRFRNESEILKGSKDPDRDYLEKIAPEKNRLGLEYVRTRSLLVDLKIIFSTLAAIFK